MPKPTLEIPARPFRPSLLAAAVLAAAGMAGAAPAAAPKPDTAAAAAAGPVHSSTAFLRASGTPAAAAVAAPAESLDTSDDAESGLRAAPATSAPAVAPAAAPAPAAADSLAAAAARAADSASDTSRVAPQREPVFLEAPRTTRFTVGGTFQLKAFAHDLAADRDADKAAGFDVRRARLDFLGQLGEKFSFEGQFRLEGDAQRLGTEAVYLAYAHTPFFGVRGGKLKRPFSLEAMQSSKSLYTIERGLLYQDFLQRVTGYSSYDLGLVLYGGFEDEGVPVTYEVGVFNGKQSLEDGQDYENQHAEGTDRGLKAKDIVFRLTAQPFRALKAEAGVSTKAAEDRTDPANFSYHVNSAFNVGAELALGKLLLLGETSWGDNHQGSDARIVSGTSLFFAFYGMGVWREEYRRGRASELVLKIEGLDPDFEPGSGEGRPNDGLLRYTGGVNWFFTPRTSVLLNYSALQPVTDVAGEDEISHDVDALWRMSF